MLARCARCQGTFTTDRYGRQTCPHCGSELLLQEPPGAGAPAQGAAPPGPPPGPPEVPQQPPPPQGTPPPAPPGAPQYPHAGPPPGWGPPGGAYPPPPGGWAPYPPPVPGPELPSPFADRRRVGLLAGFFETWKLVATQPQQFFSRVRIDQPWTAVLFGVIASTIGNVAATLYAWLSGQQALVALRQVVEKMPEEQGRFVRMYMETMKGGALLAQAVLSPLATLIVIFVAAAVLHLLLTLFRGAHRGFDATLTAVAYVSGLNLLLAVPGCGGVLAYAWATVAIIVGLGAVQRCGTGKSAAAVLAPAALLCVCCCGVAGLGLPALLKGAEEATKQTQQITL